MKFYASKLQFSLVIAVFCLIYVASSMKPADVGFQCYVCVEGIDAYCDDPFGKKAEHLKNCNTEDSKSHRSNNSKYGDYTKSMAVGCRKIDQEIEDKETVVRECAYSGEHVKDKKRFGNKGVKIIVNQCVETGCNSTPPSTTPFIEIETILATIFSIVLVFIIQN